MSQWVLRLLIVCAALSAVGFGLVLASGYSGDTGAVQSWSGGWAA
jgi:hypothetical protein